jgi:hypothetical protein
MPEMSESELIKISMQLEHLNNKLTWLIGALVGTQMVFGVMDVPKGPPIQSQPTIQTKTFDRPFYERLN